MNNFNIILVEPEHSGNVGAVARAMKNMGVKNLRLVNPKCDYLNDEALKFSVNSSDILYNAKTYSNLNQSLEDISLIVAVSQQRGKNSSTLPFKDAITKIKIAASSNMVGLIFGREGNGLTSSEIELSSLTLQIPASEESPCLNLSQAVLIICHELFNTKSSNITNTDKIPSFKEMELFYNSFQELLVDIDYADKENPTFKLNAFRKIFGRTFLTTNELDLLYGLLRQIKNYQFIIKKRVEKYSES